MAAISFRDQVVLVTGASSGLGRALATGLASQGAQVALVSRNEEKLRALERDLAGLPGQRLVVPVDVCVPDQVERAVAATLAKFGRIDVLINNAGIGQFNTVADTPLADYRAIFETNFYAPLHFLHTVAPHMIAQGAGLIIQISSLNGFCAIPMASAYCASKFAVEALSQSVRIELKPHGVRVMIVRPGVTATEFFDHSKNFHANNPFPIRHLMTAEVAAGKILAAATRGHCDLVLTSDGKILWWLKKLSPRLVDWILFQYSKPRPSAPDAIA